MGFEEVKGVFLDPGFVAEFDAGKGNFVFETVAVIVDVVES